MCEKMTPQISFNLLPLKDEYRANTTRYYETESVLKMYIQMMFDLNSKWTNDFVIIVPLYRQNLKCAHSHEFTQLHTPELHGTYRVNRPLGDRRTIQMPHLNLGLFSAMLGRPRVESGGVSYLKPKFLYIKTWNARILIDHDTA